MEQKLSLKNTDMKESTLRKVCSSGFFLNSFFQFGVVVETGKESALCTLNMVPGESVYGEKRVAVEVKKVFSS